jgi:hypothetical protein
MTSPTNTPPPIIPVGAPTLPLPTMTPERQAQLRAQLAAIPRGILPETTPRARLARLIDQGLPLAFYATHDDQGALVYRVVMEPQPGVTHDFAVYTWRRHALRALAVVMRHWPPATPATPATPTQPADPQ